MPPHGRGLDRSLVAALPFARGGRRDVCVRAHCAVAPARSNHARPTRRRPRTIATTATHPTNGQLYAHCRSLPRMATHCHPYPHTADHDTWMARGDVAPQITGSTFTPPSSSCRRGQTMHAERRRRASRRLAVRPQASRSQRRAFLRRCVRGSACGPHGLAMDLPW